MTDTPIEPFALDPSDTFESQLITIAKTHRERNAQYRESPLGILPIENWLAQISIKAVRAEQSNSVSKTMDELTDVAVYAVMVLEQIEEQSWHPAPSRSTNVSRPK